MNIFSQTLSTIIARLFNIIAGIALIRYLGVEKQGVYSYVLNTIAMFSFMADFGIVSMITRDLKTKGLTGNKLFGDAIVMLIIQMLSIIALVILYSIIFEKEIYVKECLMYASISIIIVFFAYPFLAALNSYEKMHITSIAQTIYALMCTASVMFSIYCKFDIKGIILIQGSVNFLYVILCMVLCIKYDMIPSFKPDLKSLVAVLKMSIPIGLATVLESLLLKSDVFIVYKIAGPEQNGYYSAITRLVEPIFLFISISISPIYPRISFLFNNSYQKKAIKIINLTIKYIVAIIIPFVLVISFFNSDLVRLIFGKAFEHSGPIMAILIWLVIIIPFRAVFFLSLNATHNARYTSIVFAIVIIFNIIANIILIPKVGFIVTAYINVISNFLVLFCLHILFNKLIGKTGLREFLPKIIPALILMYIFLYVFKDKTNIILISITAILIYFSSIIMLKYISKEDINLFKSILKKEPENFIGL